MQNLLIRIVEYRVLVSHIEALANQMRHGYTRALGLRILRVKVTCKSNHRLYPINDKYFQYQLLAINTVIQAEKEAEITGYHILMSTGCIFRM